MTPAMESIRLTEAEIATLQPEAPAPAVEAPPMSEAERAIAEAEGVEVPPAAPAAAAAPAAVKPAPAPAADPALDKLSVQLEDMRADIEEFTRTLTERPAAPAAPAGPAEPTIDEMRAQLAALKQQAGDEPQPLIETMEHALNRLEKMQGATEATVRRMLDEDRRYEELKAQAQVEIDEVSARFALNNAEKEAISNWAEENQRAASILTYEEMVRRAIPGRNPVAISPTPLPPAGDGARGGKTAIVLSDPGVGGAPAAGGRKPVPNLGNTPWNEVVNVEVLKAYGVT